MKNLTSPTDPQTNPLPEEVQALVAALLEGRVHSLAIVAGVVDEHGERDWIEGFSLDMDGHETDDYGFVGALAMLLKNVQEEIEAPEFVLAVDDDDDDGEEAE